jgi:NDP-mannose synthase
MTTAIVLAAGQGTRLRPYTDVIPKAMMPVGHKPCVSWIVDDLYYQHIDKIIIAVNHGDYDTFKHAFKYLSEELKYSETDRPRGTCGDLLNALICYTEEIEWPILVVYADDLTRTDYSLMLHQHELTKKLGTLAVTRNNKLEIGLIKTYGNGIEISEMYEKPDVGRLGYTSWTGRVMFNSGIMEYLKPDEDLASNVFPLIKEKLGAYETNNPWHDIGNINHYQRACELAKQGKL